VGHGCRVVVENDVPPVGDQMAFNVLEEGLHVADSRGPVNLQIFCASEDKQWPTRLSLREESSGILGTAQNQGDDVGRNICGTPEPRRLDSWWNLSCH